MSHECINDLEREDERRKIQKVLICLCYAPLFYFSLETNVDSGFYDVKFKLELTSVLSFTLVHALFFCSIFIL